MFSVKPFKSIFQLLQAFPNEEACIKHLEWIRWEDKVISPFDKTSTVYKCAGNRYKCRSTNKYFNVLTGTIFENTKIKLQHWFVAIYLFTIHKKGISSYQLAEEINITQKSSWFMLHRIRYAMEHESFLKEMTGVVKIDETFVGGKNRNRHHNKKVKNSQGRSFKDKTPVVGMLSNGRVKCMVVPDTKNKSLHPVIKSNIKDGSLIVTDEWQGYNGLEGKYDREIVEHKRGQYVNEAGFTTNSIEGFWSHLKRGVIGIYHNVVNKKHLQQYANEFSFRYNVRNEATDQKFHLLLQGTNGKRLTYQDLINVQY